VTRAFLWANLILAVLVAVGVFVQVYLIATYVFSGLHDTNALNHHKDLGGIVHIVEVLVFLSAIGAYWRRWGEIGLSFALAVIGTIQLSLASGDENWVGGLHGVFALLVLLLAGAVAHRTMRALGVGPRGSPGTA
jgi:hypothetical protein